MASSGEGADCNQLNSPPSPPSLSPSVKGKGQCVQQPWADQGDITGSFGVQITKINSSSGA